MSAAGEWMRAALGLGSNLGDPEANLQAAIKELTAAQDVRLLSESPHYRTPPWGPVPQDDYRNAVIIIETRLEARALLELCLAIERRLGRVRDVRWGPRLIDIDVLIFGGEEVSEHELTLPHPRMEERAFVLVPLVDVWPDAPIGHGRTAREALAHCPGVDGVIKL